MKKYYIFIFAVLIIALSSCKTVDNNENSNDNKDYDKEYKSTGVYEIYDENGTLIFEGSKGIVELKQNSLFHISYNGTCYYSDLVHPDDLPNVIWSYQETDFIIPISRSVGQELYIDEANTAHTTEEVKYVELKYDLSESKFKAVTYQITVNSGGFPQNNVTEGLNTKTAVELSQNGSLHLTNTLTFGMYPQEVVTEKNIIDELKNLVDDTNYISYNYTTTTSRTPSDFMMYQDIVYNGDTYRAVYKRASRPNADNGDLYDETKSTVRNYAYSFNNDFKVGYVYFFKYSPIEWDYMEFADNSLVLFSTKILDSQCENNYYPTLYAMQDIMASENFSLKLEEPREDFLTNSKYGFLSIKENDFARCKLLTDYAKMQGASLIEENHMVNIYSKYKDYGRYWFVDFNINANIYKDSSYIDYTGYGMVDACGYGATYIGVAPVLTITKNK